MHARAQETDEVVDALGALGMSEEEARAYLRLSASGPQKAGPLAKLLGWSRPETYRVLQRLVEREIVEASLTRPVEFRAVPVSRLFAQLERLHRERLERIETSRTTVEELVSRLQLRAGEPDPQDAGLRVVHGRHLVHGVLDRMVTEATRSVWMCLPTPFDVRALAVSGLLDRARRRADEELDVRILAEAVPGARRPAAPAHFVVVDEAQSLGWLASVPSTRLHEEAETAFWTNAPYHVRLQAGLFRTLWSMAPEG